MEETVHARRAPKSRVWPVFPFPVRTPDYRFLIEKKNDERRLAQKSPPTRPPPAAPPVEEWPTLVTRRLKFDRPVVTWAAFRGYPPPSVSEGYGQRPKKKAR